MDADERLLWGPMEIQGGNILSTPAVADLDNDGMPEIVMAGGNTLWTLNHDGTLLWEAPVTDESGATGASIFDSRAMDSRRWSTSTRWKWPPMTAQQER